jgi:hypothetical protein
MGRLFYYPTVSPSRLLRICGEVFRQDSCREVFRHDLFVDREQVVLKMTRDCWQWGWIITPDESVSRPVGYIVFIGSREVLFELREERQVKHHKKLLFL